MKKNSHCGCMPERKIEFVTNISSFALMSNAVRTKQMLFILLAIFVVFTSCKKEKQTISVSIEGTVMDATTNQLLDSVRVDLFTQNNDHVVYSGKNGYFNLGRFPVGDYLVVLTKKGYVDASQTISSSSFLSTGDFGYSIVKSLEAHMVPANENVQFTVYRQYLDGTPLAAVNFPYLITTGGFSNPITGITNANGIVELQNMPAVFNFVIDYNFNGIRYKTSAIIDTRISNQVTLYGYNPQANLGIVSANILDTNGQPVADFDVNGTVEIAFTLPVDTLQSSFKILEDGWLNVPATYRWENGQMKLVLTPQSPMSPATWYNLSLYMVNDGNSQSMNKVLSFTTK